MPVIAWCCDVFNLISRLYSSIYSNTVWWRLEWTKGNELCWKDFQHIRKLIGNKYHSPMKINLQWLCLFYCWSGMQHFSKTLFDVSTMKWIECYATKFTSQLYLCFGIFPQEDACHSYVPGASNADNNQGSHLLRTPGKVVFSAWIKIIKVLLFLY